MTTREDPELEAVYKAGNSHSHAAGLREVYQAGRSDEAQALNTTITHLRAQVTSATDALKSESESSEVPANTTPGQPAPGQNPPGEHPPSQA